MLSRNGSKIRIESRLVYDLPREAAVSLDADPDAEAVARKKRDAFRDEFRRRLRDEMIMAESSVHALWEAGDDVEVEPPGPAPEDHPHLPLYGDPGMEDDPRFADLVPLLDQFRAAADAAGRAKAEWYRSSQTVDAAGTDKAKETSDTLEQERDRIESKLAFLWGLRSERWFDQVFFPEEPKRQAWIMQAELYAEYLARKKAQALNRREKVLWALKVAVRISVVLAGVGTAAFLLTR